MGILLTFVNPGTESNIIQNTLLSGIFVFLLEQRMSHAVPGFNLVFHIQIFLRKYLGITYFHSLSCLNAAFLIFLWMSKRTKSSITNLKHYFGCSLSFVSISYISHFLNEVFCTGDGGY